MQFINRLDELQRFSGVTAYLNEKTEQVDSHGYSYLKAREMHVELGQTMGLDLQKMYITQMFEVFSGHRGIDSKSQKMLYRSMRDDIKKQCLLDQGEFTTLYAKARGRT